MRFALPVTLHATVWSVIGTRPALTGDAWEKASSLAQERGAVHGGRRQFAPDQFKGGNVITFLVFQTCHAASL